MDSLGSLAVFVQVAQTRSFTAAARVLGVSSSAVGKSIARMEERLGVRLFHRSTRSITLTGEGALFLERSRRILLEIEAAERELTDARVAPRGQVAHQCAASAWLVDAGAQRLYARLPGH